MNIGLLRKIDDTTRGILATILSTEGHTYKKQGEKALYEVDDPLPVYGNIGAGCVDQEMVGEGKAACSEKRPRIIRIDTTDPDDIVFGYGTYCGGVIEVLLEPVFSEHKEVYRRLRDHLERSGAFPGAGPLFLSHDIKTGEISLSTAEPSGDDHTLVERIAPPADLHLFGATPLALDLVEHLSRMDFRVHVIDWRPTYLAKFKRVDNIALSEKPGGFDRNSMILIMSHYFERDRDVLKEALLAECAFIGMLSSKTRRDAIFTELVEGGVPESATARVSSPVGIDINSASDPEIAISIIAELIQFKNDRKESRGPITGEDR